MQNLRPLNTNLTSDIQELRALANDADERRFFDDYIRTDAGVFNNCLLIGKSDPYNVNNQKKCIYRNPSQHIINFPSQLASAEFLVYRNVKYYSSTAIMVTLLECYPGIGRVYVNFYSGTWTGWKLIAAP